MAVIDVAAALVFRDGKLLITQRYSDAHLGGLWEFPGGKREPGESFEACLARELVEELGVQVEVGPLIETLEHAYPEKTVRLQFYICEVLQGEPRPIGCAAAQWISQAQLSEYRFPAADARLIEKLQAHPALWR
jgi:mutator protein MutT